MSVITAARKALCRTLDALMSSNPVARLVILVAAIPLSVGTSFLILHPGILEVPVQVISHLYAAFVSFLVRSV